MITLTDGVLTLPVAGHLLSLFLECQCSALCGGNEFYPSTDHLPDPKWHHQVHLMVLLHFAEIKCMVACHCVEWTDCSFTFLLGKWLRSWDPWQGLQNIQATRTHEALMVLCPQSISISKWPLLRGKSKRYISIFVLSSMFQAFQYLTTGMSQLQGKFMVP